MLTWASHGKFSFFFLYFSPNRLHQFNSRSVRAVFKWLSKVITWLQLLRLVIRLKDSRQFFNQWEAKPKPILPCTRDFSRASSELQVIARNCDWFIALPVPVVIGRSNCVGFGFSTVIWKPLYCIVRKRSYFESSKNERRNGELHFQATLSVSYTSSLLTLPNFWSFWDPSPLKNHFIGLINSPFCYLQIVLFSVLISLISCSKWFASDNKTFLQ